MDKHAVILKNIFQSAHFDRAHFSKPKVFLMPTETTIAEDVSRRNVKQVGTFNTYCAVGFNLTDHKELMSHPLSLRDVNDVLLRLHEFGLNAVTVVVAFAPPKPKQVNPPYLYILPDWETFDSREYAFNCRSMIINQDNN